MSLGEHVVPLSVTIGAAQSQNSDPLMDVDAVLDADAALRRLQREIVVVVAPHIKQGAPGHGHQKFQVRPLQIAAG